MVNAIESIYPKLDNLSPFKHPITNQYYRFLSPFQIHHLAEETLKRLTKFNINQILVAECGAVPFANYCAKLAKKKELPFEWDFIKVPREINDENNQNNKLYSNLSIFSDSKLAKIVLKPFIIFDEYIDTGKTLNKIICFLNLLSKDISYRVFSYLVKLSNKDLQNLNINIINTNYNGAFSDSLYSLESEYKAYQYGIYPFENRLDLIGYYYFYNQNENKKIIISSFIGNFHPKVDPSIDSISIFLKNLFFSLKKENLLSLIKMDSRNIALNESAKKYNFSEISSYISNYHILQYALYRLESLHFGKNEISEFLFQLFDMYGPIWSPLPDEYHLNYLNVFEKNNHYFDSFIKEFNEFNNYKDYRDGIISAIAELCEKRRYDLNLELNKQLEILGEYDEI